MSLSYSWRFGSDSARGDSASFPHKLRLRQGGSVLNRRAQSGLAFLDAPSGQQATTPCWPRLIATAKAACGAVLMLLVCPDVDAVESSLSASTGFVASSDDLGATSRGAAALAFDQFSTRGGAAPDFALSCACAIAIAACLSDDCCLQNA